MNPNTKKYLIIGGVALVIILALNRWLKKMPTSINADAYAGLDMNTVLSKGSTGDEVSVLQKLLIDKYNADLGFSGANKDGVDGEFGAMTEKALLDAKGVKQISLKQILTSK
jgi:hypothetical protein